jgi:hypothetical protein
MYFAFKYAKKKYNERKQAKAADTSVPETAEESSSNVQPAVPQDPIPGDQIEIAVPSGDNAAPTDEEKAQSLVVEKNDTPRDDPLQKKRRRRHRLKVILGLVAPFALQSLDTTIIASALPFIAKDFGGKIYKENPSSEPNLLTQLSRPDQTTQLDHLRLQPHRSRFPPLLGPDRRHIRAPCHNPCLHCGNARRLCYLHWRAHIPLWSTTTWS